jgi:hypothetical protein
VFIFEIGLIVTNATLRSSQCNLATDDNGGLVQIEAKRLIGKKSSSQAQSFYLWGTSAIGELLEECHC